MIISPDITVDSVKIPQTATNEGAGFGDTITDSDLEFASIREPISIFLTYGVAADLLEKWFVVNDPDTEEADPALDRTVQDALDSVKYKTKLTQGVEYERIYGWSLLVGGFTDAQTITALRNPLREGSELKQVQFYPRKNIRIIETERNPINERFGEATLYEVDRGSNAEKLLVHWTRCFKLMTRNHGKSVLEGTWDDMTCGRNIRWGVAQYIYRTGSGFAVIKFPAGATAEQMEAWATAGGYRNVMNRTYLCIAQNSTQENTGMDFDFKGAAGVTLNPQPFFDTNTKQFSIATGIPQPKLIGAQAGAVTGSEVNEQGYFKYISGQQVKLEECSRWVIDHLAASGQIGLVAPATATDKLKVTFKRVFNRDYRHKTTKAYTIDWNNAFEMSELDEARLKDLEESAQVKKLGYMSKDEVRAEHKPNPLGPLPNGMGEWKEESFNPEEDFVVRPPKGKQPQKEEEKPPKEGESK